jgi:hypothetical protein
LQVCDCPEYTKAQVDYSDQPMGIEDVSLWPNENAGLQNLSTLNFAFLIRANS